MKKSEKQLENRQVNTNSIKRKKSTVKKPNNGIIPDEDFIRARAEEIYLERIKSGVHGTPESDWYAALESFNKP